MMNKKSMLGLAAIPVAAASCANGQPPKEKPNVLLIIADDLGIGDVEAYGYGSIHTPALDSLASEGIRFNNAYATSATSTPSRYGLLTGQYPWRNDDARILPGDAPLLIRPEMNTLPKMLRDNGYQTGAIGKWHLGMGDGNVDWNRPISPSANEVGFDYTCLIAATNDRVPTVYVENGLVEGLDPSDPIEVSYEHNFPGELDGKKDLDKIRMMWDHKHNDAIINGIPRIGYMKGGHKALWKDEEMADYFIGKLRSYVAGLDRSKPFFLYYGLHQPHVPRTPAARFVGKTDLGPRGDAVVEADWCVGEILSVLDSAGLMDNTLVIFTSDNGPVLQDGYVDGAYESRDRHDAYGQLRGGKYSLYDGGAHVPMLICWKGHTPEGMVSEELVSQLDLYASLAYLVGGSVPEGLDSENYMDAFLGKGSGRKSTVVEAKSRLALRSGDYILLPPYYGPAYRETKKVDLGNVPDYELFDVKADRGQRRDIAPEHPKLLDSLKTEFLSIAGDHYDIDITEKLKNY